MPKSNRNVNGRKRNTRDKRTSPRIKDQMEYAEHAVCANLDAQRQGPTKKKWTKHDIKSIRALRPSHETLLRSYFQGDNICAVGSAGTGKTYLSTYLAISDVLEPDQKHEKVIFVRSAVATRDVGFLPGTLEEKTALFEMPYKDILADLFGRPSTYDDMKAAGLVEFMPTSFVRGLTWNNAIIVVDEVQNLTLHEINSVLTRIGDNTRVILTGDYIQSDLNKSKFDTTGIKDMLQIIKRMDGFSTIEFTRDDIVRSGFVKEWITAFEDYTASK